MEDGAGAVHALAMGADFDFCKEVGGFFLDTPPMESFMDDEGLAVDSSKELFLD
jgi:hypothetical protein